MIKAMRLMVMMNVTMLIKGKMLMGMFVVKIARAKMKMILMFCWGIQTF